MVLLPKKEIKDFFTRPYEITKFDGDYIILPKEPLFCPFCKSLMLFHDYLVQLSSQGWYHADIHMKCSYCGFYATFGIPIYHDEYEKLKNSKWHRRILDKEIVFLYPDEDIKKRLETWGYW